MVAAVRKGLSQRAVAREFQVDHSVVRRWVKHAGAQRLDRVDFSSKPPVPKTIRRTSPEVEQLILDVRKWLQKESALGEYGPTAIHAELVSRKIKHPPGTTTIKRVLRRHGVLDCKRRVRRLAPPPGWYLPEVAAGRMEIDSCDVIEDLKLDNGPLVDVFNVVAILGKSIRSWPVESPMLGEFACSAIVRHWQDTGLPHFVQFDNDPRFTGGARWPDTLGTMIRVCLALGVTPVFAPPREHGMQNAIEATNARWTEKVWRRFHHADLKALQGCSSRYQAAANTKTAAANDGAPDRLPFPKCRHILLPEIPQGLVIFVRRTTANSTLIVLGRKYELPAPWPHRLVRCEVDLTREELRFIGLRRQAYADQRLLYKEPYHLLTKSPRKFTF
jgi:putative transposase